MTEFSGNIRTFQAVSMLQYEVSNVRGQYARTPCGSQTAHNMPKYVGAFNAQLYILVSWNLRFPLCLKFVFLSCLLLREKWPDARSGKQNFTSSISSSSRCTICFQAHLTFTHEAWWIHQNAQCVPIEVSTHPAAAPRHLEKDFTSTTKSLRWLLNHQHRISVGKEVVSRQ